MFESGLVKFVSFFNLQVGECQRRAAVQVNRTLRGEVTFGFAVRGTKMGGRVTGGRLSAGKVKENHETRGKLPLLFSLFQTSVL